jgi:hypothetical protein
VGPTAAMASYGNLEFACASNIIAGYSEYPKDDLSLYGLAYCDGLNCSYGLYDTLSISLAVRTFRRKSCLSRVAMVYDMACLVLTPITAQSTSPPP